MFSSHDLEDVEEICDRVVMIDKGIKKYDGIVEYDKKCVFVCAQDLEENIELGSCPDLHIDKNRIIVKEPHYLNVVFAKLSALSIKVIDMDIVQNSLYDFFDKD